MLFQKRLKTMVMLISNDGQSFEVSSDAIKKMNVMIALLEECGEDQEIPLQIDSQTLTKVLEYVNMDLKNPQNVDDDKKDKSYEFSPDEEEFFNVDQGTLFSLIQASNYLEYPRLLDASCQIVANMIKGKTPEQIRQTFNINNDFAPEEEEKIKQENQWLEDK